MGPPSETRHNFTTRGNISAPGEGRTWGGVPDQETPRPADGEMSGAGPIDVAFALAANLVGRATTTQRCSSMMTSPSDRQSFAVRYLAATLVTEACEPEEAMDVLLKAFWRRVRVTRQGPPRFAGPDWRAPCWRIRAEAADIYAGGNHVALGGPTRISPTSSAPMGPGCSSSSLFSARAGFRKLVDESPR